MRRLSLLLVLPACSVNAFGDPCDGSFDPACLDGCPDADDDGVCDDDDVCPQGDDGEDADDDGTPDACDDGGGPDDCPDADDDGVCDDDEDPCAEGEDCTEIVIVAVQADLFPEDLSWNLVDDRGGLIRDGTLSQEAGGGFTPVQVERGALTCFTLRDSGRDGGARGLIFSRQRQEWYLRFDGMQSETGYSRCFTPGQGTRFSPPTEEAWLAEGACEIEIEINVGRYPAEVGWQLEKPSGADIRVAGRVIVGRGTGSYASQANLSKVTTTQVVTDGEYWLRMLDAGPNGGDGWSADQASVTVRIKGGAELFRDETLPSGTGVADGVVKFEVDCG